MSGNTVKYFMWPYQALFQGSIELSARALFDEFMPDATPSMFLVGIDNEPHPDRHPICIEPDHDHIQPAAFDGLRHRIDVARAANPESRSFYSNPTASRRKHRSIADHALATAIGECCKQVTGEENSVFFCSLPAEVGGYSICAVLRIRRDSFRRQFRFAENRIDTISVCTSLPEAVIEEFLKSVTSALCEPEAGASLNFRFPRSEDLMRRAGHQFMRSVAWRAFGLDSLEFTGNISEDICEAAAAKYEGAESRGRIVFSDCGSPDIEPILQFASPVKLSDHRRVRKLLELTNSKLSLLLNSDGIVGLVTSDESHFEFCIEILGHHQWRCLYREVVLCEYHYGVARLPRSKVQRSEFEEVCRRRLSTLGSADRLWNIVTACVAQRHGTTLVISDHAASESKRLGGQATPISPTVLSEEIAEAISSIDGAVLVDPSGTCHAFGVILDGLATPHGDPARGARFNSAVRYLGNQDESGCVICIVSEDGDVTLLPQLKPRVHRSAIEDAIDRLRKASVEDPIRPRVFAMARNAVWEYSFYLDDVQCKEVNEIVDIVESQRRITEGTVRFVAPQLTPTPAMNDSYFLPEA